VPPDAIENGVAGYAAARNPEIDVDKIAHFAIGIFWKAAIHSWSGTLTDSVIDLGPYTDPLRKFLCGEAGFPDYIALTIGVLTPSKAKGLIALTQPYRGQNKNWHNYLFYVPGIEFAIAVGKAVDMKKRSECFACNPLHPIWVLDFTDDVRMVQRMMFGKAKVAGNVRKYLKKP
jgi:hypothetical protein